MIVGRITRDTNIGPDQVKTGELVEVDETTFAQLFRSNAIVKADRPPGEDTTKKPERPKFRRVQPETAKAAATIDK